MFFTVFFNNRTIDARGVLLCSRFFCVVCLFCLFVLFVCLDVCFLFLGHGVGALCVA